MFPKGSANEFNMAIPSRSQFGTSNANNKTIRITYEIVMFPKRAYK